MRRQMARVLAMGPRELIFRSRALGRQAADRGRVLLNASWDRQDLGTRLSRHECTAAAREALAARRWTDAHEALRRQRLVRSPAFPIDGQQRDAVIRAITEADPSAPDRARALAEPILRGELSLLGYRLLRFGVPPDWHLDPVHGRRSPLRFWADVPYLDPVVGDHKVIWEANRHQHWLVLGRAYWLTGDETYRQAFSRELGSWLPANPPLMGINWASMLELAIRCLSWTWAAHMFTVKPEAGAAWMVDLLLALDRQLAHVARNLSCYFSPNTHLIGEALALFVCGHALPELAASPARIALGRATLLSSLARQVGEDGGHCERSTHYHRYALDFALLALVVAQRAGDPAADQFACLVERLAGAARVLADDAGRLPHIGDDDGGLLLPITGRAPDAADDSLYIAAALTGRPDLAVSTTAPEETYWMLGPARPGPSGARTSFIGAPPGPRSRALSSTGYFVSRSPGGTHVVIDAGPHGFLNGGHAHADALSLTLSVRRRPLMLDTGTGCYTTDRVLRDRFRDTAAHNTVVVDGRSQSEAAGPFHWRKVADARALHWRAGDRFDYFAGAHDGYAPVTHRRHVFSLHDDLLVVADRIDGPGRHRASAHWHLSPDWSLARDGRLFTASAGSHEVQFAVTTGEIELFQGDAGTGLGWFSPAYGRVEPLTTMRVSQEEPLPFWLCMVIGLDPANSVTGARQSPCAGSGGIDSGVGIRIDREWSVDDVVFAGGDTCRDRPWSWGAYGSDARLLYCRRTAHGLIHSLLGVEAEWTQVSAERDARGNAPGAAANAVTAGVA